MKNILIILSLMLLGGCASYEYANQVKMVSFDDNVEKGQSAGPIRGEDCTWTIMGYKLGSDPTLDRAFISTKNQGVRYVNNVGTKKDGFNAGIVAKQCLIVTGVGYK
jgi:hypothetical protein